MARSGSAPYPVLGGDTLGTPTGRALKPPRAAAEAAASRGSNAWAWALLSPTLILILALGIFPLLYVLWISTHQFDGSSILGGAFVGLDRFIAVLGADAFSNAVVVTITFLAITVPVELALGFAMALAFYREGRLTDRLRAFVIIPTMVAPVAIGVLWRFIYQSEIGIANFALQALGLPAVEWLADPTIALLSVALVDVWQWTPFMFIILLAGLRGLPLDVVEAAQVDGAGYWRTVWNEQLPMMRGVVLIATLMRFLDGIRTFDTIFVITRGGPAGATDVYSMATWREAFRFFNIDSAGAYSVIFLVALSLIVPFVLTRIARFDVGGGR